jgi:3-hydroxyisobutyrate dehydrogenase-like beta-hydroxyacid dehydrogenase
MAESVGIVGVGAMGSAIARRLLQAGYEVVGYDVRDDYLAQLAGYGGRPVDSSRAVAEQTDRVLLSLPSHEAFLDVTLGPQGIVQAARPGVVVMDTSTLDFEVKGTAQRGLAERGMTLLDCSVSGTPPMCLANEMVLFASGDEPAYETVADVFRAFTRDHRFMGEFGNASRIKYVINFLVCINNAASAEALAYATKLGLDPALVYEVVSDSFGSSRVWDRRAKLMVEGDYESTRNTYNIARKDAEVFVAHGKRAGTYTPIFFSALQMHQSGIAQGLYDIDPASLFEVYRRASGQPSLLDEK